MSFRTVYLVGINLSGHSLGIGIIGIIHIYPKFRTAPRIRQWSHARAERMTEGCPGLEEFACKEKCCILSKVSEIVVHMNRKLPS